jgi:hypothetical protein
MSIIFLSYRRDDSTTICERIYDRLISAFGKSSVFMDVDAIPVGVRFPRYIHDVIEQTAVQVAVIGPRWLDIAMPDGRRRLDDPDDFVRLEIEAALQRSIPVVPVLVDGGKMPRADELPESLRELATHNAIPIRRNPDFDDDVQRLIAAIRTLSRRKQKWEISAILALIQAIVVAACVVAGVAALAVFAILLGLPLPLVDVGLVGPITQYPLAAILIVVVLVLATLSATVMLRSGRPSVRDDALDLSGGWRWPRLVVSLATSSLSTLTFTALLITMVLRPAWCPTALCPAPQIVTRGVHDANLEVYFTALQSTFYAIPGNPREYTLSNLPKQIGAQRIDQPGGSAYKVVVGIHSLQQGRFGLLIEQVSVVINAVPASPQNLNVWAPGKALDYHANPYQAAYSSQLSGTVLAARYVPIPQGKVVLAPGEADELDVEITSRVRADIQFQVRVAYRVTNESSVHTLTLPQRFEVIFADATNWHTYSLQNGGFTADS